MEDDIPEIIRTETVEEQVLHEGPAGPAVIDRQTSYTETEVRKKEKSDCRWWKRFSLVLAFLLVLLCVLPFLGRIWHEKPGVALTLTAWKNVIYGDPAVNAELASLREQVAELQANPTPSVQIQTDIARDAQNNAKMYMAQRDQLQKELDAVRASTTEKIHKLEVDLETARLAASRRPAVVAATQRPKVVQLPNHLVGEGAPIR